MPRYSVSEARAVGLLVPGSVPRPDGSDPALPGLWRQATGFVGTAGAVVASGFARADEATTTARLETCRACDHYRVKDGRCGKMSGCGCYVAEKARWQASRCPVGKWPAP